MKLLREINHLIERAETVDKAEIIAAMKPMANKKVVWRGMSARGQTVYSKIDNDRGPSGGFHGKISDQANAIVKKLGVMNIAFGTYQLAMAEFFGSAHVMVPIQPFKAYQSEAIKDMVFSSPVPAEALAATYDERMDLEHSEIVFDIDEYYMVAIGMVLYYIMDPEGFFHYGKFSKKIKEEESKIKTYQDVIDIMEKSPV